MCPAPLMFFAKLAVRASPMPGGSTSAQWNPHGSSTARRKAADMGAGHDHGAGEIRYERPLWWALGLTSSFLVAEVVGGLLTNSLALLSDAAHMGTDVLALAVSL